jgi:transcriptional regulator with XRE-family HTH domain
MKKNKETIKATDILHHRYIGESAEHNASLEFERVNAEVAQSIYALRKEAGLTQKELADLIGTTQSVISRLEDADYEGHSLSMLSRIAHALKRRLIIKIARLTVQGELIEVPSTSASLPSSDHGNLLKGLRPGQIAPRSGLYQQIGPRGGRGKDVTVAKGEPLPPTPRRSMTYNLKDSIRGKTNICHITDSALVETANNNPKKGK